jgi:hypothetical protein
MKTAVLAALAALALPVAAQQDTQPPEAKSTEPRTQTVATPASAKPAGKATATPRENARIAKAQNKEAKCAAEKPQRKKKTTAT